jgi:hypothetical protein
MEKDFILLEKSVSDIARHLVRSKMKAGKIRPPRPRKVTDFRLHEEDKRRLRQASLTGLTLTDRRKQVEKYL